MSQYINELSEAVSAMHGCSCSYSHTATVHESMNGETVWKGKVEVFDLEGHTEATQAFAWGYKDDSGEVQYMAVINKPPINSPREAVQAAIASGRFR